MKQYIVVDDDAVNNLICKMTIKRFDPQAEIKLYQSPEEALEYISDEEDVTLKILFLDINMPTMTGWEFLAEFSNLKEENRNRFNIYILSSSFEDNNCRMKDYPFLSGFYSKPLKVQYLSDIDAKLKKKIS